MCLCVCVCLRVCVCTCVCMYECEFVKKNLYICHGLCASANGLVCLFVPNKCTQLLTYVLFFRKKFFLSSLLALSHTIDFI